MVRPRFSIVIPTYRRPHQLEQCLDAITCLHYAKRQFEVVVVSDEPSSVTEEIVQKYLASIPVRAISQEHGGPASARNTGAAATTGALLLLLDDDCTPAPDWLRQWERHINRCPGCAAGGGTVNALPRNPYSTATHALVEFIHGYFHPGRSDRPPFLASNNFCVPAERFWAIGGFSTAFPLAAAEDRDFCDRWSAQGWPTSRADQQQCFMPMTCRWRVSGGSTAITAAELFSCASSVMREISPRPSSP
jgi:glycosyltransferase involved in cell wall biosynthesis